MRASVLVGIVLIIAGAFRFFRGGFSTKETIVDVGPVEVTTEDRQAVPPWVAGIVVAAGVVLVAAGARSKTST